MKQPLRSISVLVFIMCGLLSACSGTDDAIIPTLAQLPTITPPVPLQAEPTTGATTGSAPTLEGTVTEFPIVLPATIEPTPLPSVEGNLDLETFPDTLTVGTQLTLQGTFSVTDATTGMALLTNNKQQTVLLQVDQFTAQVANNQVVQITGEVVQQPGDPTKLIRITDVSIVNGSSALSTDAPVDSLPTPTQEGA